MQLARANIGKSAEYNRDQYNKKAKAVELQVGDRVLMRNVRERGGTGKLRSFWEEKLFEVVEKRDNVPVYRIQGVEDERDSGVVHRNLIMKVDQLPLDVFQEPDNPPSRLRTSQKNKPVKKRNDGQEKYSETSTSREGDPELLEEESEDEGRDVVFYEETLPELVDLGPGESGVADGSREGRGVLELEELETPYSDIADPDVVIEPEVVDPDLEPDLVGQENEVTEVGDDNTADAMDQEDVEPLDDSLGHTIQDQSTLEEESTPENDQFETAESSIGSDVNEMEDDSEEEESDGSPVRSRPVRARKPKKVFSYNSEGQPVWEEL